MQSNAAMNKYCLQNNFQQQFKRYIAVNFYMTIKIPSKKALSK